MKIVRIFLFYCFSLQLMLIHADQVWAIALKAEKIVFSSNRHGSWDIYTMNPDGSQQKRLTRHSAMDHSPVWSPTGQQILFVSDRQGVRDIYVMNADGSGVRRVFADSAFRVEPTWSPDGKRIAFHAEMPQWSIQTATIHGRALKLVAPADQRGGNPSWSPDGNEIAFVDDVGGSRRIRIITLASGDVRIFLPNKSSWMYSPVWSPDGERLAFSWYKWDVLNRQALFVAHRAGTRLKQVGKAQRGTRGPAWSPEADKLIYSEYTEGLGYQIVVVDVQGGKKKELTHRGSNITPNWLDPANLPVAPQPHLLTTAWGKIKSQD